jgi:F-type H+-transporting ATPase subunit b
VSTKCRLELQHNSDANSSTAGAAKLRPSVPLRTFPSVVAPLTSIRHQSNVPVEDPKKKAQSIVDALPGSSLVSKTAILSAGAGVSVWAISNEFYVLNEESVVAFCLLSVFYGIFAYGGPMYKEWAENTSHRIKDILDTAKKGHAEAVKTRIEDVKPLSEVVEITKGLFEVSKVRQN